MRERIKKEIKSWAIVIAIVMLIRATIVEGMMIPTGSMEKTILIGDAILFNRFIYGVKIPYTTQTLIRGRMPKPGEIIAFKSPLENKNLVKRCIASEGDTVEIINRIVYLNGKAVSEPYVQHTDSIIYQGLEWNEAIQELWQKGELYKYLAPQLAMDNFGPVVIPEDHIFAMGDNRENSFDARHWGPLHKKYLLGKPLVTYLSIDLGGPAQNLLEVLRFWRWRGIRLDRIGHLILS